MFEWLDSFSSRSRPISTTEQPCWKHPLKESTLSWWQRDVFFLWQEMKRWGKKRRKKPPKPCTCLVWWVGPVIIYPVWGGKGSQGQAKAQTMICEHSLTCGRSNCNLERNQWPEGAPWNRGKCQIRVQTATFLFHFVTCSVYFNISQTFSKYYL